MACELTFDVVDVAEELEYVKKGGYRPKPRQISIQSNEKTWPNGCSIMIEGSDEYIILDVSGGQLRVFVMDTHSSHAGDPVACIYKRGEKPQDKAKAKKAEKKAKKARKSKKRRS